MKYWIRFYYLALIFQVSYFNAQPPLTPRLIFDFDSGDEFHYHSSSYYNFSSVGGFSTKILGKVISAGDDSVTYYFQQNTYSQIVDQNTGQISDTVFNTLIDTVTYTYLDSNIASLPEYNVATLMAYESTYNQYAAMDSSCLFGMNFSENLADFNLNGVLTPAFFANAEISPSSCNGYVSTINGNAFGIGLGKISYNHSVSGGPYYGNSYGMVYFKKDTIESGIPDLLLSGVDEMRIPRVDVFPNPCNSTFFIDLRELSDKQYAVKIFNPQGQLIQQFSSGSDAVELDVMLLEQGAYIFQVWNELEIQYIGKFMVQR